MTFVRCRVLGKHRWEPVGEGLDSGSRCRDCGEEILERYFVERDHEPEVSSPYWGRRQPTKPDQRVGTGPPLSGATGTSADSPDAENGP